MELRIGSAATPAAPIRRWSIDQIRSSREREGIVRACLLLSLVCLGACDPAEFSYITVAPRPEVGAGGLESVARTDTVTQDIDSLVAHLAGRYGLQPVDPADDPSLAPSDRCFVRSVFLLCNKRRDGEILLQLSEMPEFSSRSEALRRELVDSLQARFGASRIRVSNHR